MYTLFLPKLATQSRNNPGMAPEFLYQSPSLCKCVEDFYPSYHGQLKDAGVDRYLAEDEDDPILDNVGVILGTNPVR